MYPRSNCIPSTYSFSNSKSFGFFNGDDAVFTDFVHHFGDKIADRSILGRSCGNSRNIVTSRNGNSLFLDGFRDFLCSDFNAAFEQHRVAASCEGLQTFSHDGMGKQGGSGGTIAGDVVRLRRGFFDQLSAHIFKWIFELNFFCNGHTIVCDGR